MTSSSASPCESAINGRSRRVVGSKADRDLDRAGLIIGRQVSGRGVSCKVANNVERGCVIREIFAYNVRPVKYCRRGDGGHGFDETRERIGFEIGRDCDARRRSSGSDISLPNSTVTAFSPSGKIRVGCISRLSAYAVLDRDIDAGRRR